VKRWLHVPPFSLTWLVVVWVVLWGEITAANVLAGLALGTLVLTVLPLPRVIVGVRLRPLRFLLLATQFLRDVIVASGGVAWLAVRPGKVPRSSVVTIQLRSRNELFQTVVGEMMSLVPGSLVVDLDSEAGRLSMHVLDVETRDQADAFRRRVLAQEDRVLNALAAGPTGAYTHMEG
jgi:multicomponent Na+:H+ antiporter subunit E